MERQILGPKIILGEVCSCSCLPLLFKCSIKSTSPKKLRIFLTLLKLSYCYSSTHNCVKPVECFPSCDINSEKKLCHCHSSTLNTTFCDLAVSHVVVRLHPAEEGAARAERAEPPPHQGRRRRQRRRHPEGRRLHRRQVGQVIYLVDFFQLIGGKISCKISC